MEPNYGYRHTRGFIVFLIIIFCGWVIVAHSAEETLTGNLVGSTWTNGYPVTELTCWKGGDPNCSPGTPYVTPTGINFSYSYTELFQAQALADVLPNSGTGLIVSGFQFNWRSKNGNGWDDGRLDQLSAYVQLYSKSGTWLEAQSYNVNYLHNWTDFAWTGNFNRERSGSDLGTVLYGFAGKDNNFWMGPYGPEVTNVSFQLRYRPDPCATNPLHSPDCPGFASALPKSVTAESTTGPAPVAVQSSATPTPSRSSVATALSVIRSNAQREAAVLESVERLASQDQLAFTATTMVTTSTQTQTPQISKPAQKTESTTKTETAVDTAILEQIANQTQVNTQTIPVTLPATPPAASRTAIVEQSTENDTSSSMQFALIKMPEPVTPMIDQTATTLPERTPSEPMIIAAPVVMQTVTTGASSTEPPQVEYSRPPQIETSTVDAPTNTIATALIDRTNPLNDMLNGQQQMAQSGPVFAGPAVKSNTADNDLAGGVSISQIARVPAGFDVYTNLAMREIAFYQPKEIYRGQRTVDNVRALRSLGQDARHQEMIDQQYRR